MEKRNKEKNIQQPKGKSSEKFKEIRRYDTNKIDHLPFKNGNLIIKRGDTIHIIIKGKRDHFGKTRSEQETNLRKEWGSTISDEQLDKLKFLERKIKGLSGQTKNFIRGQDIDKIK